MHDVVEAFFGQYGQTTTGTVGGGLGATQVQSAAATYSCYTAGHYVRLTFPDGTSTVYYIVSSDEDDDIYLASVGNSYWAAADFSALPATAVDILILPYLIREEGAIYKIYLDNSIFQSPASYVQQDGTVDRTVVAPGQPYGGQILPDGTYSNQDFTDIPDTGVTGVGYPLYLGGQTLKGPILNVLKSIVPAGFHVEILFHSWCDS